MLNSEFDRRQFLKFLGYSSTSLLGLAILNQCAHNRRPLNLPTLKKLSILPSLDDQLLLASGLQSQILISYGEKINPKGDEFGINNDFITWIEGPNQSLYLWINHESTHPLFVTKTAKGKIPSKSDVIKQQKTVGGSIIQVKNTPTGWSWSPSNEFNKRIDANTPFPFSGNHIVEGKRKAVGTLANCAGGKTDWGTILSAEENYNYFYGENEISENGKKKWKSGRTYFHWKKYFDRPPEHYGWIVEIDPVSGLGQKHVSMGRFSHECATFTRAKDGRCVVYSGDDRENEHLYKFVSSKTDSLSEGTLYVAQLEQGLWIPLSIHSNSKLKKKFGSQTELLTRCREAAKIVGATPLNRPEDVEIHPFTKDVFVSQTKNKKQKDPFGSILKISEKNNDPGGLTFKSEIFVTGGKSSGFACPDNLAFDKSGNLWMTSDISGGSIGKGKYAPFKNNGLFYIPIQGPAAGQVFQVASAPKDAEFTGPCFSPDGETLFLSVQHPGEKSPSLKELTSHWPDGGTSIPRSAVVALTGKTLKKLVRGTIDID